MARENRFALDKGGEKRLVLRWRGIWKNVEVLLDGQPLGEPLPNFKALKRGADYPLPDGRTLHVRFVSGAFFAQGLTLLIDGRPLAGTRQDPRTQIKLAAGMLYFVAGLSALLGILGMAGVKFLAFLGFSWPSLLAGVVLAVLGFVGIRYRSRLAFAAAAALMVIDMIVALALTIDTQGRLPTTGIVIRVLIIIVVFRGIKSVGAVAGVEKQELADTFR